jgi:hypothetical protein
MSLVLVPVLTLMLLAAGMYGVVKWMESRLVPWQMNDQNVQWAN